MTPILKTPKKKLTIEIPENIYEQLEKKSQKNHCSKISVILTALDEHLKK